MGFEIRGFDEVMARLDQLKRRAKEIDGEHAVPASELFTPEFMLRHSSLSTFDALIKAGGFAVARPEDFGAIPEDEWEKCVRMNTRFTSWAQMLDVAAGEWVAARIGTGEQ